MSENNSFLQVKDLKVEYVTKAETVYAVNGVSFSLKKRFGVWISRRDWCR